MANEGYRVENMISLIFEFLMYLVAVVALDTISDFKHHIASVVAVMAIASMLRIRSDK